MDVTHTREPPLHWTELLTGLDPARVMAARDTVASWGLEHLDRELLTNTVDGAVAATLLVESIESISSRGVPIRQLLKKLRQDTDFWGSWAELRAAAILLHWTEERAELRIDEGRSRGAHADLRILTPDGPPAQSIEVKAVGLSDDEVAFCQRMFPSLSRLVPQVGLGHVHAPIEGRPPQLSREQRREAQRIARRNVKRIPGYPIGLRGAAIVGHGSEKAYAVRVSRRVEQAVRQLPAQDECWVAIYWSNGAPVKDLASTLRWDRIPAHVAGVVLVGCGIAFPHRNIDCYVIPLARDHPSDAEVVVSSREEDMDDVARLVIERFERSSGVRATLLYGAHKEILRRDGSRRILPFNLLLDADPREFERSAWDARDGIVPGP